MYDFHLHEHVFPPADPSSVKEVVMDGHMKVLTKCVGKGLKRSGRPRKNKKVKKNKSGYSNGWFMVISPRTGKILHVSQQIHPENNNCVAASLEMVSERYENVNCCIYDRNCSFHQSARKRRRLRRIRYYPIDKWHGKKHRKTCPCRPQSNTSLRNRLRGINTSVAEQTFSWFRGYSKHLNEMRAVRHKFLVLYYIRCHNDLIAKGEADYLNEYAYLNKKRSSKSYHCTKKRPASK